MTPDSPDLLDLLHLADSALPTGGYAFSFGLESSARIGLLRGLDDLESYLTGFLRQVATAELPFLGACFDGYDERFELREAVADLARELDAFLTIPAIHRASLIQGKSWLAILEALYPDARLPVVSEWFACRRLPLHYALSLGLGLRRIGYELGAARTLHLFLAARDQISAAIRLGLLGPREGHALLCRLLGHARRIESASRGRSPAGASRSAPLLDIAQGRHERLYTRLFQN